MWQGSIRVSKAVELGEHQRKSEQKIPETGASSEWGSSSEVPAEEKFFLNDQD